MKKIIALLLVLAMALSLAACGEKPVADEGNDPVVDNNNETPAENVTVTMIAAEYGTQTKAWWGEFETKFEAANEGIDLVVEVVSWNDIYTVVSTRISNNQAPDLLNIDSYADYYNEGLLLPTSEWVSEETYAKFYESFLAESMDEEGTVWAVPDLASARALYVNMDILNAAGVAVPTTWTELVAACEAIKASNPDVYPWGVDMTTDEGQAAFAYYTWNNGGGFVDADGNWALNSAENVEAVEFIIDMYNAGLTNTDPANETRYTLSDLFAAGKVAMMIGPTQVETYCAEAGSTFEYQAALIPANEGKANASMGVMDRVMCFDNEQTDAEMAAITAVVDAFYDDEPYAEWVLMEGFIPATAPGGELCVAADPGMESWINLVAGAQFYPAAKVEWIDVKQGVIDVLQQALLGGDVQELLDNLQAEIAG